MLAALPLVMPQVRKASPLATKAQSQSLDTLPCVFKCLVAEGIMPGCLAAWSSVHPEAWAVLP